jgi:pimeloyl-ACP methyl ester carboxylesterase
VLRDCKVAVVCGERDLITPPDHSRAIADALPNAELVMIPNAGHQALMEQPELVNAVLLRFIDAALAEAPRRRRRRKASTT